MGWRLLLFAAGRRATRFALAAATVAALALAGVALTYGAGPHCCTLVVTGYELGTSTATHLVVYAGDRKLAEASAFDGSLDETGRARFVLPPGSYTVYVTNDVQNAHYTPSGSPIRRAIPIRLDRDQVIDLRQPPDR